MGEEEPSQVGTLLFSTAARARSNRDRTAGSRVAVRLCSRPPLCLHFRVGRHRRFSAGQGMSLPIQCLCWWFGVAAVFPKVRMTCSVDGEERELGPGPTAPYHQRSSGSSSRFSPALLFSRSCFSAPRGLAEHGESSARTSLKGCITIFSWIGHRRKSPVVV